MYLIFGSLIVIIPIMIIGFVAAWRDYQYKKLTEMDMDDQIFLFPLHFPRDKIPKNPRRGRVSTASKTRVEPGKEAA